MGIPGALIIGDLMDRVLKAKPVRGLLFLGVIARAHELYTFSGLRARFA